MPYRVIRPPAHLAEAEAEARGGEGARRVVAVLGGTGFIGSHVVDELVGRGHHVYVLGRKFRDERTSARADALIQVDMLDYDGLLKAFQGVDSVVDAAAGVPNAFSTVDSIWHINKFGQENVLKAAAAAGVANFVLVSGAPIEGSCRDGEARAIINGLTLAEKRLVEMNREGVMRTCVVSPGNVVGLRNPLYDEVFAGRMRRFPMMDQRSTFLPVGYLTQALGNAEEKLAAGSEDVAGKIFVLSGEVMTFRKFLSLPTWPHKFSSMPHWLLRLLAQLNRLLARTLHWAPLGRDLCPAISAFLTLAEEEVDCSEAYRLLEVGPPPSMEACIAALARQYQQQQQQ